ncbi:S-adenosyl-L-methionine-dependent methyltransferase [Bimuria novae-zelandiae CBS 107.79]|uniref:S-adenosyl-L-methionine-dependent methyltransferase n=1 Tax=Bimuria novae-zelandiae CBS 107.79 TaxID=1447943 RepID=A0A6A5VLV2_9PLEO|nr:S-adenosyl-L-methionine-dependent methyltransferase [Bimuria novae-zelandiae CBS 107.79]
MELLNATSELHDLVLGPLRYLIGLTSPTYNILASLQFINRHQIASKVKLGQALSYEELARTCNVPIDDIRRFMRLAITFHIFEEKADGFVSHSAVSRCMLDFPLANDWIDHFCDDVWPAAPRTNEALLKWPASEEPNETAFALTNKNTAKHERHTNGLSFLQSAPEFGLLVDVGGSDGSFASAILRQFPSVRAIVQDLSSAVEVVTVPPDLEGRLEFRSHDMFSPQPVKDADYCVKILRNLIPALKNGAKIIVNDVCIPGPGVLPATQEQLIRSALSQSVERDAEDWKGLFAAADHHFKVQRITSSPGSILSVIEAVWAIDEEGVNAGK